MWRKLRAWITYLFDNREKEFRRDLRKILGFYPQNLEYYKTAFIHKSASYIDHTGKVVNNERLEFLGDAILGAVVGDFLFNRYPAADEGFLTQTRSKLVNRAILTDLAHKMGLDNFIITHIRRFTVNKHIPGNTLEAFIGAVYLDMGYDITKEFIEKQLLFKHVDIPRVIASEVNFKSRILEWGQQQKIDISFDTQEIENVTPVQFRSKIYINNEFYGEGQGGSKKEAEQQAAKEALNKLKLNGKNSPSNGRRPGK